MKNFFSITVIFIINILINTIFAIKVSTPTESGIVSGEESYNFTTVIKTVNDYLWFFIGVGAMGVLMWGGRLLITAKGDQQNLTKANNIIIYSLIGIIFAVLGYSIVSLVTKLFG